MKQPTPEVPRPCPAGALAKGDRVVTPNGAEFTVKSIELDGGHVVVRYVGLPGVRPRLRVLDVVNVLPRAT